MIRTLIKKIIKRYVQFPEKNMILDKYKFKKIYFKYLGNNVRLENDFFFGNPHNLELRDHIYIGPRAYIDAISQIKIKEGTLIGPRFTCISANHVYDCKNLKAIPFDNRMIMKPITIGKNVWIGANVTILPGVEIGEGAIIGMGTVVSKDIPPLAIAVGNPVRIVKYRDKKRYYDLKNQDLVYNKIYAGKGFLYVFEEGEFDI